MDDAKKREVGTPRTLDQAIEFAMCFPANQAKERFYLGIKDFLSQHFTGAILEHPECGDVLQKLFDKIIERPAKRSDVGWPKTFELESCQAANREGFYTLYRVYYDLRSNDIPFIEDADTCKEVGFCDLCDEDKAALLRRLSGLRRQFILEGN